MELFTGWEYLLIDACNQWGGDKWKFNERIEWAYANLHNLEDMVIDAETKPLYMKAVQAIRKAQQGTPSGHLIGFDACCSGIQIMSAVTGCIAGATSTGLVDPDVRADAYSRTTEVMNEILGSDINISRADAKSALMTSFYGSKKTPQDIFGKDTEELNAFYQAANIVAPGAWELLQDLLASWQPWALVHSWKLPDGYDARVKVMQKIDKNNPRSRVEVDELDHATFTYEFYENQGSKTGLSNAANVIHSIDAYVLRCIHRRCNYDPMVLATASAAIASELDLRAQGFTEQVDGATGKLAYYIAQYERSGMADVVALGLITDGYATQHMGTDHLIDLGAIVKGMGAYAPFEVVTIH